jgi:hypothetical protein
MRWHDEDIGNLLSLVGRPMSVVGLVVGLICMCGYVVRTEWSHQGRCEQNLGPAAPRSTSFVALQGQRIRDIHGELLVIKLCQ